MERMARRSSQHPSYALKTRPPAAERYLQIVANYVGQHNSIVTVPGLHAALVRQQGLDGQAQRAGALVVNNEAGAAGQQGAGPAPQRGLRRGRVRWVADRQAQLSGAVRNLTLGAAHGSKCKQQPTGTPQQQGRAHRHAQLAGSGSGFSSAGSQQEQQQQGGSTAGPEAVAVSQH